MLPQAVHGLLVRALPQRRHRTQGVRRGQERLPLDRGRVQVLKQQRVITKEHVLYFPYS